MGANDGIVSTASLLLGVAAAGTDRSGTLVAGVAALVAGGAGIWRSAGRVALWGVLAMGATSLMSSLFSVSV